MSDEKETVTCKTVVMGASGVGKSALSLRFLFGEFLEEHDPTIEDNCRKYLIINDLEVCFDILDTAGKEEYRAMVDVDAWFQDGEAFILVYDIMDAETFPMVTKFLTKIKEKDVNVPIIIVGNKVDLETGKPAKTPGEWTDIPHIKTSCKTGDGVDILFQTMHEKIIKANIKAKNDVKNVPIIIVGGKVDLEKDKRTTTPEEKVTDDIPHIETSAKTGASVAIKDQKRM